MTVNKAILVGRLGADPDKLKIVLMNKMVLKDTLVK